jgi:hypothetical protein
MTLGDVSDPDLIGPKQLAAMAADLGVRPAVVSKALTSLSEQLIEAIPATVQKFRDSYGTSPVLERIPMIIRKQIRRVKQLQ